MKKNKNNWRSKIDPAFDKVVRNYVTLLKIVEKFPDDGTLNLPKDLIDKSLVDNLGKQGLDEPKGLENLLRFTNKIEISDKKDVRLIIDFINSMEDSDKILELSFQMVESLPEKKSRVFYLDALKSLPAHPNKNSTDFFSVPLSLLLRYMFIILEGDPAETTKEHIEYFKKTNVMSALIDVLNSVSTNLAYQKTMPQIAEDIRNGDDKSLFKAITINKSLLFAEEVKNRFIQAQLTGDTVFFKKAGRAIASNPLARIGQYGKTYSVLSLFWYTGLYKLTNPELQDFLESCGLTTPHYADGFQKFVKRHIRTAFPL